MQVSVGVEMSLHLRLALKAEQLVSQEVLVVQQEQAVQAEEEEEEEE